MAIKTRSLGFTNSIQRLVWSQGNNVPVTAYLWGGGGGGGGNDSGTGGNGAGAGFTEISFTVNEGDVIDVAVGGPGGGGASGQGSAAGGTAGASYVEEEIFNTRSAVASPPVIPSTNSAYVSFLNTYGVWGDPVSAANFERSYVVNFPTTGLYTLIASADNSAQIYIDDTYIGDVPGYTNTYAFTSTVTAGDHVVKIVGVNTGGPGSVAVSISGGQSYSGGQGGAAGPRGSSGGGGGGGGATVIFKNGIPLAAAAGGGGGGGAGNRGIRNGENAPGSASQAAEPAGQNGQRHPGDGGGGGGGGGGLFGGNGGPIGGGGDVGALAGATGFSSDVASGPVQQPSGQLAGGRDNPNYPGSAGRGGGTARGGTAGAAVISFEITGVNVNDGTSFKPANRIWIKFNNVWREVQSVYVKEADVWQATRGSVAPSFSGVSGNFGVSSRLF
jgi:hypothetical protein